MKRTPPWLLFLFVAAPVAGLHFSGLVPAGVPTPALQNAGILVGIMASVIGSWSVQALLRFDGVRPVTAGPFAISRHPMYLAMLGMVTAAGLLTAQWAVLGAVPVLAFLIDLKVVRPEEVELEKVFGETYKTYCKQVSRWVGRNNG
jgi:protein-S-isoprenylcysteine O-methyltransferase Ste14